MFDDPDGVRQAGRKAIQVIWEKTHTGVPMREEERHIARLLDEHDEFRTCWETGEEPVADSDKEGINPFIHIQIHLMVENQISRDDPEGVARIAGELVELGISHHDVVHSIGEVVSGEIFGVLNEQRGFDAKKYLDDLSQLLKKQKADVS